MAGRGQGQQKQQNQQAKSSKPPSKQAKRTNSEMSQDSSVSDTSLTVDMSVIQNHLDIMTNNIRELRESVELVLKKDDVEKLITSTVSKIMETMEEKMKETIDKKIKNLTKELVDKLEALNLENNILRAKMQEVEKTHAAKIKELSEQIEENRAMTKEANIRSNSNEQYSRKNNVKIMEVSENENIEELTNKVTELFQKQNITLLKEEIMAIHRIPTKRGGIRPVLVKTRNNVVKTRLMRGRRAMRQTGCRLVDDVTQLNTGLINRLSLHTEIQSAWFFNGSVFGQTNQGERIRFQIYDNIDSVIKQYRESRHGRPGQRSS